MLFFFVILLRGMGIQCRLVVNMQPLPLKPSQSTLLSINLKKNDKKVFEGENSEYTVNQILNNSYCSTEGIGKLKHTKVEIKCQKGNKEIKKGNKNDEYNSKKIEHNPIVKKIKEDIYEEETKISKGKTEKRIKGESGTSLNQKLKEGKSQSYKSKKATENYSKDSLKSKKVVSNFNEENSPIFSKLKRASTSANYNIKKKKILLEIKFDEDKKPQSLAKCQKTDNCKNEQQIALQNENKNRLRSMSPKTHLSPVFLKTQSNEEELSLKDTGTKKSQQTLSKTKMENFKMAPTILNKYLNSVASNRVLRPRQKPNQTLGKAKMPQLDGAEEINENITPTEKCRPLLQNKQISRSKEESDEDFEPSFAKKITQVNIMPKTVKQLQRDRRVISTDDENNVKVNQLKQKTDLWAEVWSDVEKQWICVDLFKGKVNSLESIRKSASSFFVYIFAFQNDLNIKDVSARYCINWANTLRKSRVDKAWLDKAISPYLSHSTTRDIHEDQELRRIHEEKPLPKTISEYKDHPLYVLERHLLKFQSIYPPNAQTLGFIRGEAVYSRDCVHLLHSREIWLKQARTVKLGEEPYKIVKARPKWDRLTQSVIKDQSLEIFGYWQTQEYDPPTAENGLVPRNAYGNVELFKECMLPKKTKHLRLPGLSRICKKLGIDCANAVVGFDFHQGACHPIYDGFVVCEEFVDLLTAAWYQDQEEQDRKEQEKFETRVYGNWKKLIRGLLIRDRLKRKYDF